MKCYQSHTHYNDLETTFLTTTLHPKPHQMVNSAGMYPCALNTPIVPVQFPPLVATISHLGWAIQKGTIKAIVIWTPTSYAAEAPCMTRPMLNLCDVDKFSFCHTLRRYLVPTLQTSILFAALKAVFDTKKVLCILKLGLMWQESKTAYKVL